MQSLLEKKRDILNKILSRYDSELYETSINFSFCKEAEKADLYQLFLEIIKEGFSYPQLLPYKYEDFLNYFFPENSVVLICKKGKDIAGGFYLKPNFPGRCSHIANAGYIVKKEYRGKKIGFYLGKCSIDIAKELGYRAMMFNLVFKENTASIKLWEKLGFKIIGTIPKAAKKDDGSFQDAHAMYLALM